MILPSIANLKEVNDKFENGASQLSKDNFTFVTQIGSGAFGKVYKVTSKMTNKIYALKVLSKNQLSHLKLIDQLKNEINIFARCHHENIVALYGAFEDQNYIYMIMEIANDSNLFNKLKTQKKFSEKITYEYLRDIIQALIYLHSQNPVILHRDLKPENILIHDGKCKLSDFGWSNVDDEFRNTFCGTPDYLAPEMILGSGHSDKLDIWTIGILMFELLHGKPPFSPKEKLADGRMMQKMIEKNILKGHIDFAETISPEAVDCIKSLLNPEGSLRPSAKEILDLPYFKKHALGSKLDSKLHSTNTHSSNSLDDASEKILRKHLSEYKSRLEILSLANKKMTGQLENAEMSLKISKKELEFERAKNKKLTEEVGLVRSLDGNTSRSGVSSEVKSGKPKTGQQDEMMRYLMRRSLHCSTVIDEFFDDFIMEKKAELKVPTYENTLLKLQAIFREFVSYKKFVGGKLIFNPFELKNESESAKLNDFRKNRTEVRKFSPFVFLRGAQVDFGKLGKEESEFIEGLERYFKGGN